MAGKNVALFTGNSIWPYPHFGSELEILNDHFEAGDELFVIECNGQKEPCFINPKHGKWKCFACQTIRDNGLKALGAPIKRLPIYNLTETERFQIENIETCFETNQEVKDYRLGTFNLGYAALSTLITQLRDPYPKLRDHENYLGKLLKTAASVYLSARRNIRENKLDRIYVFNGRFHDLRAAYEAARDEGIEAYTHERGANMRRYMVVENGLIHHLFLIQQKMIDAWKNVKNHEEAVQVASNFFEERMKGSTQNQAWISFTQYQSKNLLPKSWDPSIQNIVIYLSSEDEFEAIDPTWDDKVYPNQLVAIQEILRILREQKTRYRVYGRMHPFLKRVTNPYVDALLSISDPNYELIPADSGVDTYALMKSADRVISFGSTTGIEAVYLERPSILIGPGVYQDLGGVYHVKSERELLKVISEPLEARPKEAALIYGYYMATFGRSYRKYQPFNFDDGRFDGRDIEGWIGKLRAIRRKIRPHREF